MPGDEVWSTSDYATYLAGQPYGHAMPLRQEPRPAASAAGGELPESRLLAQVILPLRLQSAANLREHWSTRHRRVKHERTSVTLMLRGKYGLWAKYRWWMTHPDAPLTITITRIAPRLLDSDNLQMAAKGVRDGIADWLTMQDNDPLLTWCYTQRKGQGGEYKVEICVEETR